MAMAMAKPSRVEVPRPSSSMIVRLLPLMFLHEDLVSLGFLVDYNNDPTHTSI